MKILQSEWDRSGHLHDGELFVLGCSTSEISGNRIGTLGSEEIAAVIFEQLLKLREQTGVHLVFQCCEHLNRALVVERETMNRYQLQEVSVIPVPKAGGSMASFAFKHLKNPVVVETISAHAGMDIGETMIGMHLKSVAVPLRFQQRNLGGARVNAAFTRPKRIGGHRAKYPDTNSTVTESCK
ncbi:MULTISPECIES: TIGR01440 family protein [Virgibacillus]|nr:MULTISPECIES: TIGR01440 family protein [Virgibacillus]